MSTFFAEYPPKGGVTSLNGLTGALTLMAGAGISITPSGTTIIIANTQPPPSGDPNTIALFGSTGNLTDDTTLTYVISSKVLGIGNISYLPTYTNQYGTEFGWFANSDAVNSNTMPFIIASTDTSTDSFTTDVFMNTGSNITVGATKGTGSLGFISGLVNDPTSTANSGQMLFFSGGVAGSGESGALNLATGVSTSGNSGPVSIATGNSSGANSGNITLLLGNASATRGQLRIQDGTEGTAGNILTSTDTSGSCAWMPQLLFADSLVNNSGTVTLVNDTTINDGSHFDYYYGTNGFASAGYFNLPIGTEGIINSALTNIHPSSPGNTSLGATNEPMGNIISNAFAMYDNFGDNIGSITEVSNGVVISANLNVGAFIGNLTLQTVASSNATTGGIFISSGNGTGVASGFVQINTGSSDTQPSGAIVIQPGQATDASSATADGGSVSIVGGGTNSTAGSGGQVIISGGQSPTPANAGNVTIQDGNQNSGIFLNVTTGVTILDDTAAKAAVFSSTSRQLLASDGTTASVDWTAPARVSLGTVVNLFNATSDPASAISGDCYFNTTSKVIRIYNGTTWQSVTAV